MLPDQEKRPYDEKKEGELARPMTIIINLALVVVFLLMNAFFVIAEFSLVRVRKSQLDLAAEEGKPGAEAARTIAENINAYLSACQLGITLASLALGWLGEPAISTLFAPLFSALNFSDAAVTAVSVLIGYLIMTMLHVVAGELVPKSFAIFSTQTFALRTAVPLLWFYKITYPVMVVFNGITNAVMHLTGHEALGEHEAYTEDEIRLLIDESTESGLIDSEQHTFVDNIFDLGDKDAKDIMTPRTDMVCIDLEDPFEDNLKIITQYKYTRYPVCRGSKDLICGFVHVKDLFRTPQTHNAKNAKQTNENLPIRPIEAVPEGIPLAKLLQTLQEKRTKIAVVVDEHGGTAGMVTASDVMEQIVGRLEDEYRHDEEEEIAFLSDGSARIDGSLPIDDVVEFLGFSPKEAAECETAGGLLLSLFDRIPKEGDSLTLQNGCESAVFTVLEMDRHRIEAISVKKIPCKET